MSNVTYRSKHSGKEIDAAIDKIPANLPEKDSLIVVNQSGESSEYAAVSTAAEPSVVVKRDNNGKIKVISAENNDEAVNLGQLNTVSATLSKEIANATSELTKEIGEKFDKSGGKVSGDIVADGNVTVGGNLVVNGTTSTVESTSLKVADKLIYVAKDNTEKLTTPAGIITPKYNGVEDGGIVYDNTGTAFVGDVVINAEGNVDVVNSNLQPIATRDGSENLKDNHVVVWDSDGKKLITSENDIDNIASKDYVVPNPELQGDEPELEGIQINGVKYKSGGGGAGIDTLTDVNLTSSGTTVAYDIASGVTVNSKGKFTYEGGEKEATTEVNVPIVAGKGTVIDKVADKEQVEVKVNINDAVKYVHNGTTYNRTICIGDESLSLGTQYAFDIVAIGSRAGAFEFSNAIGKESKAGGSASNAIGYFAKSSGSNSIAIGLQTESSGTDSIAIGNGAKAKKERSVAIGKGAECRNKIVTAIGGGAYLDGTNDLIVFGAGIPGISKNAFRIDTDYNAYAGEAAQRRLAFVDEVKPTDNPTEDSVVKISSTGGVSYEPLSSLGGLTKNSITLNLSEFTYDEDAQKFTLSQSAANTVSQIIQKQFELRGFCVAFLSIGETVFASYQINFSNITPTTTAYLSFSNPLYDSEDLSANFNVLIKPETTAQRICSDSSLFNTFVENQGVLEFFFYSM